MPCFYSKTCFVGTLCFVPFTRLFFFCCVLQKRQQHRSGRRVGERVRHLPRGAAALPPPGGQLSGCLLHPHSPLHPASPAHRPARPHLLLTPHRFRRSIRRTAGAHRGCRLGQCQCEQEKGALQMLLWEAVAACGMCC